MSVVGEPLVLISKVSVTYVCGRRTLIEGIDGFYEVGDFLSPEIQLKSIEGSKVTLTT
jgi:hypothetical protein